MAYNKVENNAKKTVQKYQNSFISKVGSQENHADEVSVVVVNRMLEEILIEVISDVHRAYKFGYSDYVFSRFNNNNMEVVDNSYYPETVEAKTEDINCPKCNKLTHASRFAPHLERCMLQGRSSSRIASQRIANNSKECSYGSDEDDDWKATPEKSKNVKKFDGKRKKDPVRKPKPYKAESSKNSKEAASSSAQKETYQSPHKAKENSNYSKNSKDNSENDIWISPNKVTPLLGEDKVQMFAGKCGVKSDHTGKYCGRSLRCHRHTDAERAVARKILTAESSMEGLIDIEEVDESKSVVGNFASLNLTPSTPSSKKKEKQRHSYSKF